MTKSNDGAISEAVREALKDMKQLTAVQRTLVVGRVTRELTATLPAGVIVGVDAREPNLCVMVKLTGASAPEWAQTLHQAVALVKHS